MKPIAITMGDPCGIGPEICVKLFGQGVTRPAFVIGDAGLLKRAAGALGIKLAIREIARASEARPEAGAMDVLALTDLPASLPVGQIDARAGQAAYDYVVKAIALAKTREIAAIVTAPLAKEAMKAAGIPYPGHTEILADETGTRDFAMMLANDDLRTVLVSIHVPLAEAIGLVKRPRVLKTIRLADQACRAYGIKRPRVAVAGLNPHAGEGGMFGSEDMDEIAPAIADARAEGIDASGPWPGDTIFMRARRGEFDIVVAQYHDQGLIPVKYLGIERGVNVTVGLPFIRTSVDHGTAFDIAGKGKADPTSLRYAFDQAVRLMEADSVAPAPRAEPNALLASLRQCRFVDLTHRFDPAIPHCEDFAPEERTVLYHYDQGIGTKGSGFLAHEYRLAGQWGTHVDPPAHFVKGLRLIDEIGVEEMILPLVVIDIAARAAQDADTLAKLSDIEAWESEHGRIPDGAFVALHTGWSACWPDKERMANRDAKGVMHFPGWSAEVLRFLAEERQVTAIGHDTTDTDPGLAVSRREAPLEDYWLRRDKWQIELLARLDDVPPAGALIVATWPKPLGGSGFPARVFALIPPGVPS